VKKAPQDLFRLARTALERVGANSRMAEAAARHLVRAEAQGLPTQPGMVADRGAVCLIDNRDGLPYVSLQWAVEEVIQRARRFAAEADSADGIEVPDELLAQVEKLCST
jgi:LDH2 family malate/lactate/ureidoglycolate dehydrogenase